MATFKDSLDRIRYFLRDKDSKIWSDEELIRYFNDIQVEVAIKTGLLERAEAYAWPPKYTFAFVHEWEESFAYGDKYQCMRYWSANNMSCCFIWEPSHWLEDDPPDDDGCLMTAPLEVAYETPGGIIMTPLHTRCNRVIYVSFAKEELEMTTEREISQQDGYYRTTSGEPISIYFPDHYHNYFVLYPRPSNYTWDEWSEGDTFSDTLGEGIVDWREGALDYSDTGYVLEDISSDNVFMVYESIPYDVIEDESTWTDELDWDEWMMKAIEAGVLSRAYGADNDGFIPSLRDYWTMRYSFCTEALKMYKRLRASDVDWVLGSSPGPRRSHLRLGPHYPREY